MGIGIQWHTLSVLSYAIVTAITNPIVSASTLLYNLLCEWELRNVSKTKKTWEFNNTTDVEILIIT